MDDTYGEFLSRERSRKILERLDQDDSVLADHTERAAANRLERLMAPKPVEPPMIFKVTDNNARQQRTPSLNARIDARLKAALQAIVPELIAQERKRTRSYVEEGNQGRSCWRDLGWK